MIVHPLQSEPRNLRQEMIDAGLIRPLARTIETSIVEETGLTPFRNVFGWPVTVPLDGPTRTKS
jgi:hypothetical protein